MEKKYHCFISYKHGDASHGDPLKRGDSKLARALQRQLHAVGRKLWQLRALHVFRDEEELAPGADLPGRIKQALQGSSYLLLLASQQSAASPWVKPVLSRVRFAATRP